MNTSEMSQEDIVHHATSGLLVHFQIFRRTISSSGLAQGIGASSR